MPNLSDSRQADADFVITPAMVDAGVWEAREHPLGASLHELVRKIFIAMMVERQGTNPSA